MADSLLTLHCSLLRCMHSQAHAACAATLLSFERQNIIANLLRASLKLCVSASKKPDWRARSFSRGCVPRIGSLHSGTMRNPCEGFVNAESRRKSEVRNLFAHNGTPHISSGDSEEAFPVFFNTEIHRVPQRNSMFVRLIAHSSLLIASRHAYPFAAGDVPSVSVFSSCLRDFVVSPVLSWSRRHEAQSACCQARLPCGIPGMHSQLRRGRAATPRPAELPSRCPFHSARPVPSRPALPAQPFPTPGTASPAGPSGNAGCSRVRWPSSRCQAAH